MKTSSHFNSAFVALCLVSRAFASGDGALTGEVPHDVRGSHQTLSAIGDRLDRVERLIETRTVKIRTTAWTWDELDAFQNKLWRAMALDPARVEAAQIPAALDPETLTRDMSEDLEKLVRSRSVAEKYGVEEAFDEYVALCRELIELRGKNLYRKARILAKRGVVENSYFALAQALADKAQAQVDLRVTWNKGDRQELLEEFSHVRMDFNALKGQPGVREPASVTNRLLTENGGLLWVLFPLLFLTGLVGGLAWNREPNSGKAREEVEPNR